jgi:hypothetical protein
VRALREWFAAHPDSLDLLQGPMLHDNLHASGAVTHLEPTWGAGMYGQWARDPRLDEPGCEPFEIQMHGLGLFACRKDARPGLNPRLRGFGAEEGYLHELFRRRGGRVVCHPRLRWAHRFLRPLGVPYPNRWEDRMRNYLVSWGELGWDVVPIEAHYPHRGIAIAFRRMIEEARRRGWEHVLVLEDDAVFLDDGVAVMRTAVSELFAHAWDLCYLGACVWSPEFPPLGDSTVLRACGAVTCTHAVAFHRRAYERLLAEIPAAADEVDRWLRDVAAVDQYLSGRIADGTYRAVITSPRVASQPNLLDYPDGDGALGARYVI